MLYTAHLQDIHQSLTCVSQPLGSSSRRGEQWWQCTEDQESLLNCWGKDSLHLYFDKMHNQWFTIYSMLKKNYIQQTAKRWKRKDTCTLTSYPSTQHKVLTFGHSHWRFHHLFRHAIKLHLLAEVIPSSLQFINVVAVILVQDAAKFLLHLWHIQYITFECII